MYKKLLFASLLLGTVGAANAQTTIFEDSFETYNNFAIANIGTWTLTDIDGAATYGIEVGTPPVPVVFENSGYTGSFIIFNRSATAPMVNEAWAAHTGDKVIACFNAVVDGQSPAQGPNNDWLISPQIQLGTAGNSLTFWAKSAAGNYPDERFKVGVSTTGTATTNFTVVSPAPYVQTTAAWTQYTYNLDTYAGQNVYISINCISNDQFALLIDDFKVTATTLGTDDFLANKFAVYPNPAKDVLNLTNTINAEVKNISITDLNGRIVKQNNYNGVANQIQINVADLAKGAYILTINSDQGSVTKKILKD
ncbi:T9SS-dependent choice-of-anchor J family protein [Flavobacterium sp. '19STA2R22 D10 B1']|uniref:T9SS-dependent choice-of-anchor J family protein n=1 Tax=Flavobacterium aerium TaxID=3037261 RepID=UPI00278BDBD5|nr:choice-of-anchor J domain-containing protein [Flavobacterium sp. '19STA2R22 D10 B1']